MVLSETVFHLFMQSQLSVKEIEESLELGLSPADLILHSNNLDLVSHEAASDQLRAMVGEGSSASLTSLATDSSNSSHE